MSNGSSKCVIVSKLRVFCLLLGLIKLAQAQQYPEMIRVEGDTFTMGNAFKVGESDELPQHKVWISTFKMAKTETTVAQYQEFCKDTKRSMPPAPPWNWIDNHPMVNVTWYDAQAYCVWLGQKIGKKIRLPTEAEWEYAASGGRFRNGALYCGSSEITLIAWNNDLKPYPVARKYPNELGLHDMSGNAWEWCSDWYGPYTDQTKINPKGPLTGSFKVVRGGSWEDENMYCRTSNRSNYMPSGRNIHNGFRVVEE